MVSESKENMSKTADILQSLYGQENYPQEVSIVADAINIETLHDIWIEIDPDMTSEVSIEESFVWCWLYSTATHTTKPHMLQA